MRYREKPRHRGYVTYGLALLVLALLAWGGLGRIGGHDRALWWTDAGATLCIVVATAGCLVAAAHGGAGKRAWLCFAGGCAMSLFGQLIRNFSDLVAHLTLPFPSL